MQAKILQAIIISGIMAFTLSGVMLYVNVGLIGNFITIWGKNFLIAYSVAFPLSLILGSITARLLFKR